VGERSISREIFEKLRHCLGENRVLRDSSVLKEQVKEEMILNKKG